MADEGRGKYLALEDTDLQSLENFAGLVAVADILECLGGILTADIEEDFLTTSVHICQYFMPT